MSLQVPAPPPPSSAPPNTGLAPPGEPPGGALFHSALAEELARTAPAEGLNKSHGNIGTVRSHRHGERAHRESSGAERFSGDVSTTGAIAQAPAQHIHDTRASSVASKPAVDSAATETSPRADAAASGATTPGLTTAQSAGQAAHVSSTAAGQGGATNQASATAPGSEPASASASPTNASTATATAANASAGEAPAQAGSHPAPGGAQQAPEPSSVPATSTHGLDSTEAASQGSPAPQDAPAPPAQASASTESAPPQSAPAASVAGASSTPAPRSATGPEATIVHAAATQAAIANAQLPAGASGAGSEQAPTSREAAGHLIAQAAAEKPAASAGSVGSTQSAAPPQPAEAALTTSPAAAPASAAGQPAGVALQDMIESIHATIELAARQGMAQARIALEPAELGSVRIHLSQTADGLLARVSAETPAAAQALAGARAELQQSLSSLGVSLLRLDINSFGQSENRHPSGNPADESASRSNRSAPAQDDEREDPHPVGEIQDVSPTGPGGARVDVLA